MNEKQIQEVLLVKEFGKVPDREKLEAIESALREQPAAPVFEGVAKRKLDDLLDRGFKIDGLAIRTDDDTVVPRTRGLITTGGAVYWWTSGEEIRRIARNAADRALREQAVPDGWQPVAENINALPGPVRRYIHDLVSNADPAGTVRDLTIAQDTIRALEASNRALRDACATVEACFLAAECEGLSAALAETDDERLKDLVERRLMYSLFACQSLSAAPQPAQAEQPTEVEKFMDACGLCRECAAPIEAEQPNDKAFEPVLIEWDAAHRVAYQAAAFRPSYFKGSGFIAHNWVVEAIRSAHIDGQRFAHGLPPVDRTYAERMVAQAEQPKAAQQEPVLFVSPGQLEKHADPDDDISGRYLPARKTPAGKFTQPLYTAAPQREPMTDEQITDHYFAQQAHEASTTLQGFAEGVRYAERFHNNTKKEQQ